MTCDTEKENSAPLKRSATAPDQEEELMSSEQQPKKAKIEVTLAASEAGQLTQIESEFQVLKSLIPDIANRQQINEVKQLGFFL